MPTAFLIEDSSLVRQDLIATLAEMSNVEVVGEAVDEEGAVEWLALHGADAADMVILDLGLAGGSGLNVLARLRGTTPHHCVVVLSNHVTREVRARCEALGAVAVFAKASQFAEFCDFCASPPTACLSTKANG